MTTSFPLLKLPLIALEPIINQLDFLDLMQISMKSTKLKCLLELLKLSVQSLHFFITERSYEIWIRRNRKTSQIDTCDSVPVDTVMKLGKILGEPVEIWKHTRNEVKVKSDLSKLATLEAITKFILSISRVAKYSLTFDDAETEIRNLFIWQITTQMYKLHISSNGSHVKISPEDLVFILEELTVDRLELNVYCPGFEYQKPIKHPIFVVESPCWIDFDKFSLASNIKHATFLNQKVSDDVLNRLIENWAKGKNPKLREVKFTWEEYDPLAWEQQFPQSRTILPNRNIEQLRARCMIHRVMRDFDHRSIIYTMKLSVSATLLKVYEIQEYPSIAKIARFQLVCVCLTERFYGISILRNQCFFYINVCNIVPVDTITEHANIQGEPVQIWNQNKDEVKVKSDLSILATLEAITKYILKISRVATYSLTIDDAEAEIRSLFIWQITTQMDQLNISPNHGSRVQISPEDLTFLLEEISLDCLRLNVDCPGFKYQKPIKHSLIVSQSPSWIGFYKFSLGPETIIASFSDQKVSNAVLNRLIKDWTEGKNLKLREVKFTWKEYDRASLATAREHETQPPKPILPNRNIEQLKGRCINHRMIYWFRRCQSVCYEVRLSVEEYSGLNGIHLEDQNHRNIRKLRLHFGAPSRFPEDENRSLPIVLLLHSSRRL